MLVKQDREEIMAPIKDLQQRLLIGVLPLVLLLLWVAHRQSKALSAPLEKLIESVDQNELENYLPCKIKEVNTLSKTLQRSVTELNEAVKLANKANKAKEEFLASMSHELRTPLTAIVGNSDILRDSGHCGGGQCEQKDALKIINAIESAGRNQIALVNDILDMSKIDSGKFTVDAQPYNVSVLLDDIERMLATRAKDAGLELVVKQKNHEEYLLRGDSQRISQILINLIGNAIKFTDKGTVTLITHTNGEHLYFTVKDTGIGISPDVLDKLFKRFEQADGSISRRFGGSGLGLFISLNLAELMGGTINVSSQEGVGSVFELILPYQPSVHREKRERVGDNRSVLDEKLSGHVLVAEDTPELQLLERRILEGMGLTVTTANNGKEAVDLASIQSFDIILMDMQMPEVDGIEATKILRSQNNQIPVVALTANVMQKHRDAFNEAGCDGFLAKPIDKQELRRMLKKYLQ